MGLIGCIAEICVICCIIGAIICNAYLLGTCDMLQLGGGALGEIGPWRADIRGVTNGCVSWSKSDVDDTFLKMGRATSMMAFCFAFIFLFVGLIKQCCCKLPCANMILNICSTCITLSLALVWPMIRSEPCKQYGCTWGGGATALLLAVSCFLLSFVM